MKVPDAVGVPLMVMVLPAQLADMPAGNPLAPETPLFAIPVAPVVVCVTLVISVLIQTVGEDEAAPAVLLGDTVIVPVAEIPPQPPLKGIV